MILLKRDQQYFVSFAAANIIAKTIVIYPFGSQIVYQFAYLLFTERLLSIIITHNSSSSAVAFSLFTP